MRDMRAFPGPALLVALTALLAPASAPAQTLTPEQVMDLESVADVAMSPDGRRVAYTVTRARAAEEDPGSAWSNLYLVSAEGGEPTPLVEGSLRATDPVWSVDGEQIFFLARLNGDGRTQVYRISPAGGDPVRVTRSPTGVSDFGPAPAGGLIAYVAAVRDAGEEAASPGDDEVVRSEMYEYDRLWIQPPEGDPYAVTPTDMSVRSFAWAPDGRRLALQITEEPSVDAGYMYRRLYTVMADPGAEPRPLTGTEGKLGDMVWSPDGLRLAFLGAVSFNDPIAQSVFVVSAQGGQARNLTGDYEGSGTSLFWVDDETVGFVAEEGTRTAVNRIPVAGGRIRRIAGGGEEIISSLSRQRRGRSFAVAASTGTHPDEVYVGSFEGDGGLTRLTHHNPWLDGVRLGRQETIEWTGPDGLTVQGVLVHPVNELEGRRHPLAILPHGGPEGISQDGWTTRALYPAQVLAGRGYAVLMPNYRGSAGRGVAFSKADHRDLGGEEFLDVIAGIDHLAAQGLVDPDRVGISGTSYGGYFSAWAATKHADRFKVAIPFAGLTNMTAFMGTTDIPVEMSAVHFDLFWFDNPGVYWDRSPIAHVSENSTPTLIGHGLADERVHPEQSLELYTALRLKGVPTELVYYPREPHGLTERAHQLDFMKRILEWMDRYLKEGGSVSE